MSIDELDDKTRAIIRQLAAQHQCTVEELMRAMLRSESGAAESADRVLGLFADEPDLMDKVVEAAYESRQHPLPESQE